MALEPGHQRLEAGDWSSPQSRSSMTVTASSWAEEPRGRGHSLQGGLAPDPEPLQAQPASWPAPLPGPWPLLRVPAPLTLLLCSAGHPLQAQSAWGPPVSLPPSPGGVMGAKAGGWMGRCVRGSVVVPPPTCTPSEGGASSVCGLRGAPLPATGRGQSVSGGRRRGASVGTQISASRLCVAALCRWDEVTPAWGPRSTPRKHLRLCSAGSDVL